MLVENRRISLLLFVFFQLAPSIAMEEKREKRLSRGSKVGDEREATRKGVMVVVVVVSLEAATKGSGNYGEAANSREAEAKAAVGSQADLRRGFAPRFIRAAFLRRLTRDDVGQNFRPRIQSRATSFSFRSPSLLLFVIPALSRPIVDLCSASDRASSSRSPPPPPRLFFRLEKPRD